jgi:hypothetical protein
VLGTFLVYALFAIILTWPLLPHLGSSAYLDQTSPHGGDLSGSIAQLRELVDGRHNPFGPGRQHDFNAPAGLQVRWALNLASLPSTVLLYVLAFVFGATAAYGLFTILGYVASGLAMFLLVRYLTRDPWIALVCGWAFAFYPFAVVTGEHPAFVHGWVFVVMFWRLIRLYEEPTPRNGIWAGLATLLVLSWTQYYVLLGGIAFGALTVGCLVAALARRQLARHAVAHLPSVGLAVGFVLVMRWLLLRSGANSTLTTNSLTDVINSAARVPMYLVPPPHHVLGGLTTSYLDRHGWNGVEWTLYVGITVLVLALCGVAAALIRRLPAQLRAAAWLAACVVVAGFVFSLPPTAHIGGSSVHLPSDFVYHASKSWRLYSRFVIVVMLGLCVLAALGLSWLSASRARVAVLVAATVLVPLDLWARPPHHLFRFQTDPIYKVLRAQPQANAAEYPLRSTGLPGDYLDLYHQAAHGKPILNGYFSGYDQTRALSLSRLDAPETATGLATLGVRYVLLTPWRVGIEAPDPGRPGRGYRLIDRDAYGSLYRVTARPGAVVFERNGFWGPEGQGATSFQWAGAPPVRLGIFAACDSCSGSLSFTTASFGRPRFVVARVGGRDVARFVVGLKPRRVAIQLSLRREATVELHITPAPQQISKSIGGTDTRIVSIFVKDPSFRVSR